MRVYSTRNLPTLVNLSPPNINAIIEQIEHAASRTSFILRTLGLSLPMSTDAASHFDVSNHLRRLVDHAFAGYADALAVAPAISGQEVEGFSEDELFDVWVSSADFSPEVELCISMRIA